jgi:hypothetical protein
MKQDRHTYSVRKMGAEIERHPHFPDRTNVSFIVPVDRHRIDARFYERRAGETMSSGTGSTGAAVAAMSRGMVESPVDVLTPAGPLNARVDGSVYLTGPAEIVAEGEFLYGLGGARSRTNAVRCSLNGLRVPMALSGQCVYLANPGARVALTSLECGACTDWTR